MVDFKAEDSPQAVMRWQTFQAVAKYKEGFIMINIDTWIAGYKVRAINWIDNKSIYFNVQYFMPGQSIGSIPTWDKTVYITDNEAGQNLVNNFTHSLVEHVAMMKIKDNTKVVLTA